MFQFHIVTKWLNTKRLQKHHLPLLDLNNSLKLLSTTLNSTTLHIEHVDHISLPLHVSDFVLNNTICRTSYFISLGLATGLHIFWYYLVKASVEPSLHRINDYLFSLLQSIILPDLLYSHVAKDTLIPY